MRTPVRQQVGVKGSCAVGLLGRSGHWGRSTCYTTRQDLVLKARVALYSLLPASTRIFLNSHLREAPGPPVHFQAEHMPPQAAAPQQHTMHECMTGHPRLQLGLHRLVTLPLLLTALCCFPPFLYPFTTSPSFPKFSLSSSVLLTTYRLERYPSLRLHLQNYINCFTFLTSESQMIC